MAQMNIHTLLMVIRGFSNKITVRGLASDLGISYSTLARCKSGTWPRSITLDAMRSVLEDCRMRYFEGDESAIAQSVLMQLENAHVNTQGLEKALQGLGYEAFVQALLLQASSPSAPNKGKQQDEATEPMREARPASASSVPEAATIPLMQIEDPPCRKTSPHAQELMHAVPLATVLMVGMFRLSLSSLFAWAAAHQVEFLLVSLAIALLPALAGVFVDAPLAWRAYAKTNPGAVLSYRNFAVVAKYGHPTKVAPGAGRYNLTRSYLLYQPVCNLLGMMCYVSLFSFVLTLPGFKAFFAEHDWTEFFKAGIVVAFFVAYGHAHDQYNQYVKNPDDAPLAPPSARENPDNYLPTRIHVWANTLHLVWTISLLIVLLLSLIAYSITMAHAMGTPLLMLWPHLQAMAFFVFSSASPTARRIRAKSLGNLVPGITTTSMGFALLSLLCYVPSWSGLAVCVACVLWPVAAQMWIRNRKTDADKEWLRSCMKTGAYSVVTAASIVILLAIGFMTSTLV